MIRYIVIFLCLSSIAFAQDIEILDADGLEGSQNDWAFLGTATDRVQAIEFVDDGYISENNEGHEQYYTVENTAIDAGDIIDSVKMVIRHRYTGSDTYRVKGNVVGSSTSFIPLASSTYVTDTSANYVPTSDPWTVTSLNALEIRLQSFDKRLGAIAIRVDRAFILVYSHAPAGGAIIIRTVISD